MSESTQKKTKTMPLMKTALMMRLRQTKINGMINVMLDTPLVVDVEEVNVG